MDYWDRLGWRDPFSDHGWSLRQHEYVRALRVANGAYTPQLVVNGQTQLNGANARGALVAVDAALLRPAPALLEIRAQPGDVAKPVLTLDASVEMLEDFEGDRLELRVALFENGLLTHVSGGENGGRTLRNDFIVRRLVTAFSLAPSKGIRKQGQVRFELSHRWKAENVGVAAFLQDPKSMRILAATALSPPPPPGSDDLP